MIATTYDPEADALYVRIAPKGAPVAETREVQPGVMLDYDDAGRLVGIEVLDVERRQRGAPFRRLPERLVRSSCGSR
ncbi:MAG: DUF2283 domain-containing protein [Acetobacteraceae bacterium]|nr:DUF2283 domain-containing protein [Acetobacteraceae bacterium]